MSNSSQNQAKNIRQRRTSLRLGRTKILLTIKGSFLLVIILSLLINPGTTHAGFFSFISGNSKDETISEVGVADQSKNSQTLSLLEAPLADLANGQGGGDIAIVEDTALLPESGPLGAGADAVDIPESDQIDVHVVKKGENLAKIAKMYKVSENTIIWANDLKDKNISEGDVLVILPVSGLKYTIKKGDTLKSIAKKFSGDVDDIGKYNSLTVETMLEVGQEIIIPDTDLVLAQEKTNTTTVKNTTSNKTKTTKKKKEKTFGTNGPTYSDYYIRPIDGGRKSQGLHGYNGIDLAAPIGTPIHASADGVILVAKKSGYNGGYGKYVVIEHDNGTQTLYGHMSQVDVSSGDEVSQGDQIGEVGSTGHSTGPHVHFEIRGAKNPF